MNEQPREPVTGPYVSDPIPEEPVEQRKPEDVSEEPFTLEQGKERVGEAVDRVKQAGKEITTRPLLDAVGSYFRRGVDALIGFAEGMEGKDKKKDRE